MPFHQIDADVLQVDRIKGSKAVASILIDRKLTYSDDFILEDQDLITAKYLQTETPNLIEIYIETIKNVPNGIAGLDPVGLLPSSVLPPLATTETFTVASESAMLALSAQRGDYCVRTDFSPARVYILAYDNPAVLGNWILVSTGSNVIAVNGQTGPNVLLTYTDINSIGNQNAVAQIANYRITGTGELGGLISTGDSINYAGLFTGTSAVPDTTGSAINGAISIRATGVTDQALAIGVSTTFSYIQSRNPIDHSINNELKINPNGGLVCICSTNIPTNVSILKIGDGTTTDTGNQAALTKSYSITGTATSFNGLNIEITGTASADNSGRAVRAIKSVAYLNPGGFTMTNTGGSALGIEGVSRILGTGTVDVATALYGRVLHDNDVVGGTTVNNAHGLLIIQHLGGVNTPFQIATGITLIEQGSGTRSVNSANLVLGASSSNQGNLTGVFTGRYNIYGPSTFKNYLQGSLIIGSPTDSSYKLDIVSTFLSRIIGANAGPSTSGSSLFNGTLRIQATGIATAGLDIGVDGTNSYSWVQSRNPADYTNKLELRLNPNGGNVYIGAVVLRPTKQTHSTGATVTWNNSITNLYVNPATNLAALTITLPSTPADGQEILLSFGGTITSGSVVTTLSIVGAAGHTLLAGGAITTAQAGDGYIFKFESSTNFWRML